MLQLAWNTCRFFLASTCDQAQLIQSNLSGKAPLGQALFWCSPVICM